MPFWKSRAKMAKSLSVTKFTNCLCTPSTAGNLSRSTRLCSTPCRPGEIESHGYFGPWNSQDPGATPVSGTYKFDRANLAVFAGIAGILASPDNFHGALNQIETNGTVDVPNFKVTRAARSVPLQATYHAFVNSFNGDVRLENVNTLVAKTELLARGS